MKAPKPLHRKRLTLDERELIGGFLEKHFRGACHALTASERACEVAPGIKSAGDKLYWSHCVSYLRYLASQVGVEL